MTEAEVLAISTQFPEEFRGIFGNIIELVSNDACQEIAEEGARPEFVRALIARAVLFTAAEICTVISHSLDQTEMLERIYLAQ